MATDSTRVLIKVTGDHRLVGAVTGAVEHFAEGAGFDEAGQKKLMAAAEQAYLETCQGLASADTPIVVAVEHHPDRLEIRIEHVSDEAPALGLDAFLSVGNDDGPSHGSRLLTLVDRVLYDSEGGISRLRLIKYFAGAGKKPC